MLTNVYITPISEKTSANDFAYEVDISKNDVNIAIDCPDSYTVQTNTSWTSFLTGQRTVPSSYQNNERKYPIRVFAIQAEA